MLLELRVKNLGIIDQIDWELGRGLNVITGETGAGKSLVIDAVETLLGGKVSDDNIRFGADTAEIEGIFSLPRGNDLPALRALLAEKGLEAEEDTLILHCEVRRPGRSLVRANGRTVPRETLRQLERYLLDIHGQSEHLSLLDRKSHLDILDAYAHTLDRRQEFSDRAVELNKAEQELKKLAAEEKDLTRREEFLRFQIDEITRAKLQAEEETELERERNILASCEQLKAFSYEAYQALSGEDSSSGSVSVSDRLAEVVLAMKKLVNLDPALKSQLDSLEETALGLEEFSRSVRDYADRLENDPGRLEEVETRLELIRDLKRKYGSDVPEILEYLSRAAVDLEGLSRSSERRSALETRLPRLKEAMGKAAAELSTRRLNAAGKLVAEVRQELQDLDMSQVEFEVSITRAPSEEGIPLPGGEVCAFHNDGIDIVEFMAATNPGEPLKPLAGIASTGEISRFLLALKGALSTTDRVPVLVFDEIDVGVGGRSGDIIGKKLWNLARDRQVICVTHLPQIAAFADAHFSVAKEVSGDRTTSRLETLNGDLRVRELAAMLAGPQYTGTALRGARELIQKADTWKENHRPS